MRRNLSVVCFVANEHLVVILPQLQRAFLNKPLQLQILLHCRFALCDRPRQHHRHGNESRIPVAPCCSRKHAAAGCDNSLQIRVRADRFVLLFVKSVPSAVAQHALVPIRVRDDKLKRVVWAAAPAGLQRKRLRNSALFPGVAADSCFFLYHCRTAAHRRFPDFFLPLSLQVCVRGGGSMKRQQNEKYISLRLPSRRHRDCNTPPLPRRTTRHLK